MGMEPGLAPEEWLFEAPERVVELHRAFVAAGADIVLTCTFGATPLRLTEGPLLGRAREVNLRAAELAREGAGTGRLVAGSLGPTGQLIEPYGLLNREAAVAAYAEQAQALADGGVDLLVLETIFAVEEAVWAVEGIQSATDLPLVVSFSFDMGTRTMMGLSPTDAVAAVVPLGHRRRRHELRALAQGRRCRRHGDPRRRRRRSRVGEAERGRAAGGRRRGRVRGRAGDARRARRTLCRAGRRGSSAGAAARRPSMSRRSPGRSGAEARAGPSCVRAACCSMSPRCRPAGWTRRRTGSSTGSSRRVRRGGSCCRCTSLTGSARRTRRGRRLPVMRACWRHPGRGTTTAVRATRARR